MIKYADLPEEKKAIIFELDNVLIPEKDYDLQVYYLFANFIEYLETFPPAQELLDFMTKRYYLHGRENMFEEVAKVFGIDIKYKQNLELLYQNAKLPLKLLLYQEMLEFLQELIINRKQVFLLTAGNPQQQLNKITQTEWHGLDKYLKVYFADEYEPKPSVIVLENLMEDTKLNANEIVIIGNSVVDKTMAITAGVKYIPL